MPHLIETIYESSVKEAINKLKQTHALIVERAIVAQKKIGTNGYAWGSELKRLEVSLPVGQLLVGKATEKFVELINILATTERTISSLCWLEKQHSRAFLRECHSSTSDDLEGNDIVLVSSENGNVIVRCEVTDVTSNKAGQNGKEKKDIKNLGCEEYVPNDGATRYIATSHEFSNALTSEKRKWAAMHYRYILHETKFADRTVLLEIVNA
jgi:hypothetical protein